MKIIGKAGEDQYIVIVHRTEMANLLGYTGVYDSGFKDSALQIGTDIPIKPVYDAAAGIRNARFQIEEIEKIAGKLSDVAKAARDCFGPLK